MKHLYSLSVILSVFMSTILYAQDGAIDKSFGDNGTELTRLSQNSGNIQCTVVYPDGKIISAGDNYMVRNKADGTIDSSFGNNGKTYDGNRVVSAVTLQPDNKIVVSANYYKTVSEFAAIRYLPNGKADNSFGTNGIAGFPVSANSSGVGLQSDGKIIVSGTTIESNSKAVLVRFNINGSIDSTFGVNGLVTLKPAFYFHAVDIAIQSNNKIVMACNVQNANGGASVYRFNANGSIDSNFGTNGSAAAKQLFIGSPRRCIAIQADGKIAIAGGTNNDSTKFGVVRFLANGQRDALFGNNGFVHASFGNWFADVTGITLQQDGKLIAVGSITDYHPGNFGFAAARFSSDGALDESFGSDGKISRMDNTFRINANAIALQPNGKIIIAGYVDSGNTNTPNRFSFVSRLNNGEAFALNNNILTAALNSSIEIFPNPVKDVLHITHVLPQSSIEVINNNGIIVIRNEKNISGEVTIPTAKLHPGIYTLRIINSRAIKSSRFTKL